MAVKQTEAEVRAVSDRFYDALEQMANGDATAMADVWSHEDDVTTMHPIGGREVGWSEVREPWSAIAAMAEGGTIERGDQLVRVVGDLAYELATEKASLVIGGEELGGEYRATNVYRREDGEWKVVHHHTDLDTEFAEVVQRLAGGS